MAVVQVSLGRRYGKAIYELLREENTLERSLEELRAINTAIRDDEEARSLIDAVRIGRSVKKKAVEAMAEQLQLGTTLRNFLCLLADKGRLSFLPDILRSVEHYYYLDQNILPAEVTSATPLKTEELDTLTQRLGKRFEKSIEMRSVVDPELIGGLRVRVGSLLFDGSLRAQLNRMQRSLLER